MCPHIHIADVLQYLSRLLLKPPAPENVINWTLFILSLQSSEAEHIRVRQLYRAIVCVICHHHHTEQPNEDKLLTFAPPYFL